MEPQLIYSRGGFRVPGSSVNVLRHCFVQDMASVNCSRKNAVASCGFLQGSTTIKGTAIKDTCNHTAVAIASQHLIECRNKAYRGRGKCVYLSGSPIFARGLHCIFDQLLCVQRGSWRNVVSTWRQASELENDRKHRARETGLNTQTEEFPTEKLADLEDKVLLDTR